jgi:hypothetical protein
MEPARATARFMRARAFARSNMLDRAPPWAGDSKWAFESMCSAVYIHRLLAKRRKAFEQVDILWLSVDPFRVPRCVSGIAFSMN